MADIQLERKEEAERRFPVGTKFRRPAHMNVSDIHIVVGRIRVIGIEGNIVYAKTMKEDTVTIYDRGVWAEIINEKKQFLIHN